MSLRGLFKEIESPQFAAYLSVLSGFSSVERALEDHETLKQLVNELTNSPVAQDRVVNRIARLLKHEVSPDVEHPDEAAITAYLFALTRTDSNRAMSVARQVVALPNLWWARHLAEMIIANTQAVPSK